MRLCLYMPCIWAGPTVTRPVPDPLADNQLYIDGSHAVDHIKVDKCDAKRNVYLLWQAGIKFLFFPNIEKSSSLFALP